MMGFGETILDAQVISTLQHFFYILQYFTHKVSKVMYNITKNIEINFNRSQKRLFNGSNNYFHKYTVVYVPYSMHLFGPDTMLYKGI